MRRAPFVGAAVVAALAATAGRLGRPRLEPSRGARDPEDPTADNTDLYAFTAKDAPGALTVVANWIPFEEPAGGPYFGKLDPKARYYVKIDNTGDGARTSRYRLAVQAEVPQPELVPVCGADGDSIDDPDMNFVQTYDLYTETYGQRQAHGSQA